MFYIDDATLIRTIAQFRIDINQAMTPLKALQGEFLKLDKTIQQVQAKTAGIGKTLGVQTVAPVKQSGATLDQYGNTLNVVGTQTAKVTAQTQKMTKNFNVLESQLSRRIGWFFSGMMWYGGIRAMQSAVSAFSEVESSMVVIERTTNDVTFSLEGMRKELIEVGKQYGHTWETVQEAAIRWTQAGYNMKDVAELTRLSLLGLNVAEMDVNMATQGLISIMAQWSYGVSDLEEVIDKLNKTSDNYAVTTGDLVEALQRSSGAARALGLSFEETVGLITATRVASGRLGKEVGKRLPLRLETTDRKSLKLRGTLIETIRSQAA